MSEKLFYSMGEVTEMFDVRPSLLRHWEAHFPALRPKRNKKGNRLFSPQDVELLKRIYHLVKERGMTLDGARKALGGRATGEVGRDAELMERLLRIRALLVEVREELKAERDPEEYDGVAARVAPGRGAAVGERPVEVPPGMPELVPEGDRTAVDDAGELSAEGARHGRAGTEAEQDRDAASKRRRRVVVRYSDETGEELPAGDDAAARTSSRKSRRRREEPEPRPKELFAFYEQSLF